MLTAGTQLGNYEILDLIGMGGMGTVYRARHSVLARIDAVKVLALHLTLQNNLRQRFMQEAKIQAKLRHPNIAEVYDCFSSGDQYCISMEYFDGVPLSRLLSVGVLDETRLRKIFSQILDGMAFSHKQNVIHRDLKSSNIIISPQDEVKIVDFGIAKILDQQPLDLTMANDQLGTTRYMAPEQILNSPATPATDVYALGILLYESVTGHTPFEMFSDYEIKRSHVESVAPDPREKAPYIGESLSELIMDCLRKKPADRPQTAGIVLERFNQIPALYVQTPPVIAEHPTTISSGGGIFFPEETKVTPKKWDKKSILLALLALLVIASTALYLGMSPRSETPAQIATGENQQELQAPAGSSPDQSPLAVDESALTAVPSPPVVIPEMAAETNPPPPSPETTQRIIEAPEEAEPLKAVAPREGYLTLDDVIKFSETHTHESIAENLIIAESKTGSWQNYPDNWQITYYAPNTMTKRKTVIWEKGELQKVTSSTSPPLANNQKLTFALNRLNIDSDVVLDKANEYALENGITVESISLTLEKTASDSVSPSWICELFNNRRRVKTLRFSTQTGEILSVK